MKTAESDLSARRRKIAHHKLQAEYRADDIEQQSDGEVPKYSNVVDSRSRGVVFDIGGDGDKKIFDEFEQELAGNGGKLSIYREPSQPIHIRRKNDQSAMDHFRNGLWVISAVVLFSYLDVPKVLTNDHRVKLPVFLAGLGCSGIFLAISAYHVVFLSWIKRLKEEDCYKSFPLGVPLATIAAVISGILYIIAFWSVWSIFTPVILFAFTMPVIILISYF